MDMENKNIDVVCIGQAVIDCITRGKEENLHKKMYIALKIFH